MNMREQYEKHEEYIISEGLDKLIDFKENIDYEEKTFDMVGGKLEIPFPPQTDDLVRLHKMVRSRKSFTVLEFGLGYSTIIFADALRKNQEEWEALKDKPEIRNRFMFQLFAVDASKEWINKTRDIVPEKLLDRINFHFSEVEVGQFNGQLCHYYKNLPDIVPDFIYLDGPAPKDVQGNINGLSFKCDERTIMSGDLLLMESTFLPGTFILVDGRTNNVRFLKRNFSREYQINWDREGDITTFELDEDRLGRYNILGTDYLK